jgi:SP family arabinose:H+ symporter-like MFS transporter
MRSMLSGRSSYIYLVSFVAAFGGFVFGYDLVIISGANTLLRNEFNLSEKAFGFATASADLGCIAGPLLGAWLCDRIGRKMTLVFAGLLFGLSAIGTALPREMFTFNLFRIIGGVGMGICSIASPMYIVEIAPAQIRGRLGLMFQLAVCVGALMSVVIAWQLAERLPPTLSWRWMFASEIPAVLGFLACLSLVPRSPRWLAGRGRHEEALDVLGRFKDPDDAKTELEEIRQSIFAESGTFSELFMPGMRRVLFIGIMLGLFCNLTGWSGIGRFLPDMFQKAGYTVVSESIKQSVQIFLGIIFLTLISIWLVDRVGRRALWNFATFANACILIATGLVFHYHVKGGWLVFMVFLVAVPHAMATAPLPWLMMSEIFPTRIRARAVAICTTFLWIASFLAPQIYPIVGDFSQRTIGSIGMVFWVFAGFCFLALLFGLTLLPETKGRTLEQIAGEWLGTDPPPNSK